MKLTLTCLRDGTTTVMNGAIELALEPRRTIALAASTIWGGFFDTTYAFRFGEPAHDVTIASLVDAETGLAIADAFHFPLGRGHERHDLDLTANVQRNAGGWRLDVEAKRFAQSVRIRCGDLIPSDNWFHLPPGTTRSLRLDGPADVSNAIGGTVEALNGLRAAAFGFGIGEKRGTV